MSEIKYINIEDDRFWDILFDEACVEGGQANRIRKELEQIVVDEKEITRKSMQEIVERLEELFKYNSEQADIYIDGEGAYMREKKEMYMDRANCYGVAIRTVREVGGMND